jgi:pimeloyl-ACP methyl ester carboxylesterase
MSRCSANGIEIEFEVIGNAGDDPLLLISGLGAQLVRWDDAFCAELASRGHRVIRFDNRDVGLSTRFEAAGMPDIGAAIGDVAAGRQPAAPYLLDDMAADAVGLLDALGIGSAHIVGASMGGMIAQIVAARHPARVGSLVSIMSTSGNLELPEATPEAVAALLARPPSEEREDLIANNAMRSRVIGGPHFDTDEAFIRDHAARQIDRAYYPQGFARQFVAIRASGSRAGLLETIAAPTLVIHGADDPLVRVEGGRDTAARIAGAKLMIVEGMGHFIEPRLVPRIVAAIAEHCHGAAAG